MPAPIESAPLFQAQWPRSLDPALRPITEKVSKVFWNIISIVIFPIGLVRLARSFISQVAFKVIIPGSLDYTDKLEIHTPIKTPDGAIIDSVFVKGKHPDKVVLFEGGNCEMYETSCPDWFDRIAPVGASLLFLNPRGVGLSRGMLNSEGYALDVYAAAEYLIQEKGIDPENILFAGFSMGAANTTRGAALIQEKYPDKKISALNINSFSSLETEIYYAAGRLAYLGSKLFGLNKDVKKAWDTLKGEKVILHNPNDPVIPLPAQLATAVKKDPIGTTRILELSSEATHFGLEGKTLELALRHLLNSPSWWFSPAKLTGVTV
ncbi:MAG: hypothetical protein P0S96_02365 [Simkaniaceae bacterium]|nr:hypothetical protein [Candidatus Sacchlamyda saccharinae]